MAIRSLTNPYILMRSNAQQNRNIFNEVNDHWAEDDEIALVGRDLEVGVKFSNSRGLPPEWVDTLDEIQLDVSNIEEKMSELFVLHDKQLNRPTLDDSVDEEHEIEIITQEITHIFMNCNKKIKSIGSATKQSSNNQSKTMTRNVMMAHASTLQNLSTRFRKSQSSYLKKLQAREDRSKHFFSSGSALMIEENVGEMEEDLLFEQNFSKNAEVMVQENTLNVRQQEEQIQNVVQSISDLAEIFRDLSNIVVEQGTVLDRIDYNVEMSVNKTEEGLKQLQKAESYQKKNRKLYIIFVLGLITTIMLIILIAVKSN